MKAGKEKRKQSSYFLFKMLFSNIWISDVDLMCFLILFPRVSFYACHICSQFKSAKFYIHALFREIVLLYLCSITLPSFSQIYWVGPIIGAVLAGGLYEYVFCPDVELKRRFKEAFSKAAQQTKGSYMAVDASVSWEEGRKGGGTDPRMQKRAEESIALRRPSPGPPTNRGNSGLSPIPYSITGHLYSAEL